MSYSNPIPHQPPKTFMQWLANYIDKPTRRGELARYAAQYDFKEDRVCWEGGYMGELFKATRSYDMYVYRHNRARDGR